MPSRRLTFAFVLTLILPLGCRGNESGPVAAPKPPIIIVSIDTLRADHLPAWGYDKIETPAIDALRADGILFRNAWSNVPLTLPSHVSILTGLLPTSTEFATTSVVRLNPTPQARALADATKKRIDSRPR